MVENIQCPVCTLFLHAGMDLSDHLETHPKEQVIKALVQMTITGGGSGSSGISAALTDEEKPNVETISKASTNEKEHEISTNSTSNCSTPLPTPTSAHNSLNLSFCPPHKQENIGFVTTHKTPGKHIFNQQNVTSSPAYQKSGEPNGTIGGCVNDIGVVRDIKQMPTDFSTYSNRYQNQHQQQQTSSQQHQQHVADAHQRPPPPPPPPQLPHQITPLASSGGSHSFQALQQHQPPMLAHQHQNSVHHHQHQHHTQQVQQHQQQNHHRQQHTSMPIAQQQNLKIIYSSTLPPPPPLQLFSYQPPTQPQHQKPPPAYGTAISQIRSQHNQNKQTLQQHQMQQRSAPLSAIASTSKHATLKQNLPPNLLAAAATQQKQYQSQHHETAPQQTQQHHVKNFAANISLPKTTGTYQQRVQPPTTALPLTIVAAAGNRQLESPYPAILTAAIASPSSSSSVLRYAESPVTVHYLERDNGDFIVQEIPKHIVECVEKDNGEFSVIERIYQSPPSVLHIHDDDEDDDIESGNGNTDNEDVKINVSDETNKSLKDDENNKEKHEDDEDFMSAESNSDMDDSSEKSFSKSSGKLGKDSSAINTPLEQTAVNSSICSEISVVNSNSNSNFSTTTNTSSGLTTRKKSSKNTITVLSDVQLNLNEYLDLVGNIIASSKIAQNRNASFSASTSASATPLLKIEKVEPYDEYEQYEMSENMPVVESEINVDVQMEATSLIEPPKTTNNKDNITETDELIANKFSNKSSPNEINTNKVGTATPEENKLNEIRNVAAIYTGHATSVIRMATTNTASQQFMKETELLPPSVVDIAVEKKIINDLQHANDIQQEQRQDAEDLSQTKIKHEVKTEDILLKIPPPIPIPPLKKGPKKLVIKPKSNKTDANNIPAVAKMADNNLISDEQPTTSAKAQKQIQLDKIEQNKSMEQTGLQQDTETNVIIKSEYSITEQTSILEQHLKLGFQHLELKEEQPSARNDTIFSVDSQKIKNESDEFNDVPKIYTESNEEHSSCLTMPNVTEDARVLLNFANSKKSKTDTTSTTVSFPSSNSIFAGSLLEKSISTNATCSSSSTQNTTGITTTVVAANFSTSNSASAAALSTLRCDDEFIVPDATDVQEIVISSSYSSQSASDIALNNYNNVTMTDQHQHNFSDYPFSFLYGGGSVAQQIETKGNFSPIYQHQPHDATTAATLASGSNSATIEDFTPVQSNSHQHQHQQRYHHHATTGAGQWYHAVSTSNADFEAALAVDCTDTDNDVGKYLDLDACKRDNMTAAQAARCSSSSSFAAATESSLAGCTTDALNIRTDEKMPAKGEISEQESNCDIENSWSQPMYGDIPARFFKTSFPGLFPQENWNGVEYFTVHDLSASAGTTSASNRATKSFDFRLPLEAITTTTATAGSLLQQQCSENLPSSSKKKRKRESNVAKNATATSRKVAATVTSQELLLQQQRQQIQQQHHQQQQQQQHQLQLYHQQPTTSAAILAGPLTAAASSSAVTSPIAAAAAAVVVIHKQRKKIYQCVHCPLQFTKLKDRNLHMIALHNYIRQNRRLVSMQTTAVTVTTATATITSAENLAIPFNGASGSSNILTIPPSNFVESIEDSKQGIVKIEVENAEQAMASLSTVETITAKSELVDEKDNLALMPTTSTPNTVVDLKPPNIRPLALTHATKLATLYRMLVSFNISTLKQNSNLSEVDEKLMESYIFFCYICRQHFNTVKFYDAHLTEHPAECFTCGKKFHRWKNFSLHLKRHLGWKEFGCSVCDKKFVVRSALVEHMRMHTGLTPLKCKICGKNFKRYSNLTQHRKRHGRQILRKKEFVCHCGEVLPSKARFLWHKETHDAKPKCCPYCCDRFVHANSLRRHIRLAHSDKFDYTEPMECPMCKQVFAKSSIRAHMATHSMDTQHDCPICNKSFSTKWNLKIHSWVHANRTAKPFKCEHCPKAFVREVDFKNHMNAHKQIKPYTCEYCGCKFIRKYNYMRHRREHHGNKKFTCDLCKKSFHRHYYLIEHRRIHTGERPFQCTICGKSSTTKTNHNKHLKIHHSRDPFTVEA